MKRAHNTVVGILACLAVVAIAMLTGCEDENREFTFNAAQVATALTNLNRSYDDVSAIVAAHLDNYTPDEQQTLELIDRELHTIKSRIQLRADSPNEILETLITAGELNTVYAAAERAYLEARELVSSRQQSFAFSEWVQIAEFDTKARQLDKAMMGLIERAEGSDVTQVLDELLTVAIMAGEIAVLLAE